MPKWLKVTLITALIAAVVVIFIVGYFAWYANNKLNDISTAGNQGGGSTTVQDTLSPNKEPFSFILLGIDYRPELPGRRTDVVMVGAMHPDTQEAVLVSLPRDTYFELPGYHPDKLNHYYPKFFTLKEQGKLDSPTPEDEMKLMLGKYMGVPIDYAAVINFQGFSDVVDAVGGVNVNVDQNMCYNDNADGTHINLKTGQQTLNGKNALDFVRYRKSNCRPMTKGTTDADRNVRQNAVLKEIVGNLQSLGGLTKVTGVIDAMADNFKIDMTPSQIRSSISTYLGIDRDNIHYISVDGNWISPYIYPDTVKLEEGKQAIKDVLAGKPLKSTLSGEAGADSQLTNTTKPGS
ncbi:LCP family protein [Paenibacillus alvei]|nr:LCP family protein [Paenibacillus alvei]MCY9757841.1 LCP family protein [Paenibacillus alvei]